MRMFLKVMFAAILVWMVAMTTHISLQKSIFLSPTEFSWRTSPWAVATLFDAYFGFITFFVWVCFKESGLAKKALWFVLIMTLGNIAMSSYVLIQLFRLPGDEPLSNILVKRVR